MKRKTLTSALRLSSLLLLVSGTSALADERGPTHFSGVINDYTLSNVAGGPYEMHGQWSMDLHQQWGTTDFTADFSADMTMAAITTALVTDATPPNATVSVHAQTGVGPHTHHIKLTNIMVTPGISGCPNYKTNPSTTGFQVNGTVSLMTGNGTNAPFETTPPSSTLQVCVTGGTEIAYSNVTLVFGGPPTTAVSHFGTQAIHGVVRRASDDRDGNR
jgi:hypothetical protein